ncbi:MAG: ornithine cyclodeaminase family protein [Alphaproteobacteria bacterium]|nr:ornithine cyclodeaminase family protein [Alphaproteobacteria bacterium]
MTLSLNEQQISEILKMEELIEVMEKAMIAFSAGEVTQPPRKLIPVEPHGGYFGPMPAISKDAMGIKLVNFYPGNAALGIHTHNAMILLFKPETGEPLAIMEGGLITEMRTAAVSAVATRPLASPDAKILAVLGAGVQAKSHVEAMRCVRDFDEVRVWARNPEKAKAFADEHGAIAMDAEDAVRGADVVVTATSSQVPVLKGEWLKDGAHVNAVGAPIATWRELDDAVMSRCTVIADSRDACMNESGDMILSGTRIHAEIGEVLAGDASVAAEETTLFKSVGLAVQDVFAAQMVYEKVNA